MTTERFRQLALSLPETVEQPHFDRKAFKAAGKRIFATMHEGSATVNLKLSPVDQSVFCSVDRESIYPVPNKWGLQGWTTFELRRMTQGPMMDALKTAYSEVMKGR